MRREQQRVEVSYPEVGATRGRLPSGYRHGHYVIELGHGDAVFAVELLQCWRVHRGTGVGVHPLDAPIDAGTTVVLTVGLVGLHLMLAVHRISRSAINESRGDLSPCCSS